MAKLNVLLVILVTVAQFKEHSGGITIRTHQGTELEKRGKEQLQRLLQEYPLEPYLFAREIVIQSYVVPHSHPVLTLNTRYLDDDVAQLSTLLHEQFHWFLTDGVREDVVDAAITELKRIFPDAPDKPLQGARDLRSTYLHLIVCAMELEALASLVGRDRARAQLSEWEHYTWIYSTVLDDPQRVLDVMTNAGIPLAASWKGPNR